LFGMFSSKLARDHQVRTAGRILFSGLGGRKAPNSIGKISTFGVLRLRATNAVHTINL
jgi:hypothetical protein